MKTFLQLLGVLLLVQVAVIASATGIAAVFPPEAVAEIEEAKIDTVVNLAAWKMQVTSQYEQTQARVTKLKEQKAQIEEAIEQGEILLYRIETQLNLIRILKPDAEGNVILDLEGSQP